MPEKLVTGVFAAVLTPRDASGRLDEAYLSRNIEFLVKQGIQGLVLNGATGEYALTTSEELTRILAIAKSVSAGRVRHFCGIGSAGLRGSIEAGQIALKSGASALLLPSPHFFPYSQEDVEAFFREVSKQLPAPILLYNIPKFTTSVAYETLRNLMQECPNIAGIKDSSGTLDIMRKITQSGSAACRVIGSDEALVAALKEKVLDGVISGVAGVLPELTLSVFEAGQRPESAEFQQAADRLAGFLPALAGYPVPWALKWIAEVRGFGPATFAQPVSPGRLAQAAALQKWFKTWQQGAAHLVNS